MKVLLLVLLTYGCAQLPRTATETNDDVSVHAALNHAKISYLKGCVEAYHDFNIRPAYQICQERAQTHLLEIKSILNYNDENSGGK